MHSDGYIELKDRSKDIIISGGENISSIEIEECYIKTIKYMQLLYQNLIKNGEKYHVLL